MSEDALRVLFLCTGNSARSIMAEAILRDRGAGRFVSLSAGSQPTGRVNPAALRQLGRARHGTEGYSSKSWDEFDREDAGALDIVITVCDSAAKESCPTWPGDPVTAHWGIPDPAAATGTDAEIAAEFELTYRKLDARIGSFLELPLGEMSRDELRLALREIGRSGGR